jgi:hypothetical protein
VASQHLDRWAIHAARWLSFKVIGTNVDRINVAGFFLLGARVRALLGLKAGAKITDVLPMLADADEYLEMFENVSIGPKAEQSVPVAQELRKGLETLTIFPPRLAKAGVVFNLGGASLNDNQVSLISKLVEQFEAVLCSEMPSMGIFYLTPKRAYSTAMLLSKAEDSLSATVRTNLTEFDVENIREAGRCLVFDRFTATGFHALRAVESVARRYYLLVTGRDATGATLGKVAGELAGHFEKLTGKKTPTGLLGLVTGPLDQLCKLYRNPVMHPQLISLDEDQAIEAFEYAMSAISTMVRDVLAGGAHFSIVRFYS